MELAVNIKYPLIAPRPGPLQPLSCLVWHFSKSLTWLPMAWRDSSSEKNQWTGISWVQRFFLNLKILLFPIIISWRDRVFHLGAGEMLFSQREIKEVIIFSDGSGYHGMQIFHRTWELEAAIKGILTADWQEHRHTQAHHTQKHRERHTQSQTCRHAHTHTTYRDSHATRRHILHADIFRYPHFHASTKALFTYRHLGRCPSHLLPHIPPGPNPVGTWEQLQTHEGLFGCSEAT